MGGAQPLAAAMAGASSLNIECQQSRIDFRLGTRYLDRQAASLDEALALIAEHTGRGEAVSIGLLGNAAEILPELVRRGVRPDLVTDQTSAHDPLNGYLPAGWSWGRLSCAQPGRACRRDCRRQGFDAPARARHARFPEDGRAGVRLRQQYPADGLRRGRGRRLRFSRFRAGLYPPAVLPRASGRSAGWHSPAIRPISPRPTPRSRS